MAELEPVSTTTLTPRGLRTRTALIDAARPIFERDGFSSARITDIADAARVAHGTFYTYFDSKEEIFREVITTVHGEMLVGADAADQEPARPATAYESIEQANRRFLEAYRKNALIMVIWEEAATLNTEFDDLLRISRQRFTGRSETFIRRLQEQGQADPGIDPRYAAHALGAMVSKFAYNWFAGGEDFEFEDAVTQLSRLWSRALGITQS